MRVDGEKDAREALRIAGVEVTPENVALLVGAWVAFRRRDAMEGGREDTRVDQLPGERFVLHVGSPGVLATLGSEAERAVTAIRRGPPPLTLGAKIFDWSRPLVMGIVNVTPDSFSDGGRHASAEAAIAHGLKLVAEGADILDIGGESTRPRGRTYGGGAETVAVNEELQRVLPVIRGLAAQTDVPLSIDTRKSEVAEAAVEAGATLVNDVTGLIHDARIGDVVARTGVALCLMHVPSDIEDLAHEAPSDDVFGDVLLGLESAIERATARGVGRDRLLVDPGLGFGKTVEGNLSALNHVETFAALGLPVLIGASRKSSFARVAAGSADAMSPPDRRLPSSLATAVAAVLRGAHVLRVHDVRETVEAIRVAHALRQ